jgi:hypothetical protein
MGRRADTRKQKNAVAMRAAWTGRSEEYHEMDG